MPRIVHALLIPVAVPILRRKRTIARSRIVPRWIDGPRHWIGGRRVGGRRLAGSVWIVIATARVASIAVVVAVHEALPEQRPVLVAIAAPITRIGIPVLVVSRVVERAISAAVGLAA